LHFFRLLATNIEFGVRIPVVVERIALNEPFSLNVNGKLYAIEADPSMPLLYALRNDIGLNKCGACTVHLDGEPIRACITPVASIGEAKVVTLGGLGSPEAPHPLQTAYVEEQVPQCGYCINGWIMTAAACLPVRLQYMREQATGWDPKGPASVHRARAGLDAAGTVIAYEFSSKGFSRIDVQTNGSMPTDTLTGQMLGVALVVNDGFGFPAESYRFANKQTAWETIRPLLDRASPLRSSHLRDPVGPQIHFASESFIDEIAAALGLDSLEFRLRYVKNPRDIAVIAAAAERSGWVRRPSPQRKESGNRVAGRGLAYAQRNGTVVAVVAEVEVVRPTGKIFARKFTVAHDCGQIINPDGLKKSIEANIVQGLSRALWEAVTFDHKNVTTVDWLTYPILDITETPETPAAIDVVLINRPELAPSGAGEPSIRPVAAAIANAIFDATGVRIRRVPSSPRAW
jgi:nicotinate dehydrogenase subunit B